MFCRILEMVFQLRGKTGNETASITIPGDEASKTLDISKVWQTYSFPVSEGKKFLLKVVTPLDQVVYLQPAYDYEIYYLHDNWKYWNCSQENENYRCARVRGGHFAWSGLYNLTYVNPGMILLSFIFHYLL